MFLFSPVLASHKISSTSSVGIFRCSEASRAASTEDIIVRGTPPTVVYLFRLFIGGLASVAADVLASVLIPINYHDTTTPPFLVEALAAPAAVPEPVLSLERTARQRTFGCCGLVKARRRRVRDGLHFQATAGLSCMGVPFWRGGGCVAVAHAGADVFAGELVVCLIAHGRDIMDCLRET